MLKHFTFFDGKGTEFVSVCDKQHEFVLLNGWRLRKAEDTFPHGECDLCGFEQGKTPHRVASLMKSLMISVSPSKR